MRDINYKTYSFRLDDEVVLELKKLRAKRDISWNLLFKELIK